MSRVAVLKIGVGDFREGFDISLQFWSDNAPPTEEICGRLPENLKVRAFYELWRSAYLTLKPPVPNSMRSQNDNSVSEIGQTTNRASSEGVSACRRLARSLEAEMKHWLKSGGTWQPIREGLLKKLSNKRGKIRIILQINNPEPVLWKLPWHVWDLLQHDDGSDLEIALSSSEFQRAKVVKKPVIRKGNVRILGVLGDSTGIDVQTDREEVERLSSADPTFLDRPQTQDLLKQLRSEIGWDIFLFSGHSERVGESARIYINQNSSLDVLDFRNSLREAIGQGLKIAIFNSCDSVGLVRDLAQAGLYIPVLIVMREEVPDAIAQAFLKEFLTEYASGQSLQTSVRRSRQRLEAGEQVWPGVTWLPAICQNPAEVPPTWEQLQGITDSKFTLKLPEVQAEKTAYKQHPISQILTHTTWVASVAIAALVLAVRQLGMLQGLELQSFDQMMRLRPDEGLDRRILVVAVTENDLNYQDRMGMNRQGSLSDTALAQLLKNLEQFKPRAIGLDIYRDFPVKPDQVYLAKQLQQNDRFFAICKHSDPEANKLGIKPPNEIPQERTGFNDAVLDFDGIRRRHLWYMTPNKNSPCPTEIALNLQLAVHYLAAEGIQAEPIMEKGYLRLGNTILKPLKSDSGGYKGLDDRGYQLLLNYRSRQGIAQTVTLTDVLQGKVGVSLVKDRIIIIGVTAPSVKDDFYTPYSVSRQPNQTMRGVFLQAQMVSQILSAVLDKRPLLGVWPFWGDAIWIWCWSLAGGTIAWYIRSKLRLGLAIATTLVILYSACFVLFIRGYWVPIVPSALASIAAGVSVLRFSKFKRTTQ